MALLVYGATGYTGKLVSRELTRQGVTHVVAARRREAVESWARVVGMEARAFGLEAPDLRGVSAILNCAGPFARTSLPLVDAALAVGAHYLDLAGEVAEHEALRLRGPEAASRNVMLLPGAGFGVVPTECAAALALGALPTARRLTIAYQTVGGASSGTLQTVLGGIPDNGFVRRGGALVPSEPAERVLDLDLGGGLSRVATNPFRADLVSAYVSTGVPDIETYATFPLPVRALMRSRARRWGIVKRAVAAVIARAPEGPNDKVRERGSTRILVIAGDERREARVLVRGPDAYEFTARAATAVCARLELARAGFMTPFQVFGAQLLRTILDRPGETVEILS